MTDLKVIDPETVFNHCRDKYFTSTEVKEDFDVFLSNFNELMETCGFSPLDYCYDDYLDDIKDNKYSFYNRNGEYFNDKKIMTYDEKLALLRNMIETIDKNLDRIFRTYWFLGSICFNDRRIKKIRCKANIEKLTKTLFYNIHISAVKLREDFNKCMVEIDESIFTSIPS